jgi:hypothetical protein
MKQNQLILIGIIAIFVAIVFHALSNRYTAVGGEGQRIILDRLTGRTYNTRGERLNRRPQPKDNKIYYEIRG